MKVPKHNPETWHQVYANIITLTAWMAENGYPVSEVARAVEKPHNYEEQFLCAELDLDDADLGLLTLEYEDNLETEVVDVLRDRKVNLEVDNAIATWAEAQKAKRS